ncbi:hypothetical protein KBC04_03935 [Candidatus Babeliales bacterium]|nr:hypothetical protein [Candidatus Babeliales bacterium]MBP9843354.1 hypothetical protein [Candidatus Babeliales bacterium]
MNKLIFAFILTMTVQNLQGSPSSEDLKKTREETRRNYHGMPSNCTYHELNDNSYCYTKKNLAGKTVLVNSFYASGIPKSSEEREREKRKYAEQEKRQELQRQRQDFRS